MTHHQDELLAAYRKIEVLEKKLKIAKDALSALKAGVEIVRKK